MRRFIWALCLGMLAASPAAAEEWKYDLVVYGWLAGLEGAIGIADVGEQPVTASFDDLAGFVDFAMAGHFEARKAAGLLITDIAYTGLSSERDAEVANQTVTVDMDLDQWIIEAGGGYRATPEFDLLVVGRYYILDLGGTSTSIVGSSAGQNTQDWGDIYIGGRYSLIVKEKWHFSLRGDVGVGGSDFAWFGNAAIGYRFSDLVTAGVAWRVLSLDYQGGDDSVFVYDMVQNGLGVGVEFSF
jgi:hypothetical protein